MKEKIFQKLKQEYSHLGLGDEMLQTHAENLAGLGFVNDENLDVVVAAQKTFLEKLQKTNDSRVTEAVNTAKRKAKEEFEVEAKKKEEEKKAEEERKRIEEEKMKEMPEWYKAEKTANDKMIKELLDASKKQKADYDTIIKENETLKRERAAEARNTLIASKAKELGIPEWRIKEGFVIAADADEKAIIDTLTTVSNNIKTQMLPKDGYAFPHSDGKVEKAEADAIAKSLVG